MPNEEAIKSFLYDVYGYGKIDELVSGQKPKDLPLVDFLDGTIIGTFRRCGIASKPEYHIVAVNRPGISLVRDTSELSSDANNNPNLPFHINNRSFFRLMGREEVGDYLSRHVFPLFRGGRHKYEHGISINSAWGHEVTDENFRLLISGFGKGSASKGTVVDFSSPPETKDGINSLVRRYHGMMNRYEHAT
jgi:hypothetical protein